jgi:hypothetical protein
LSLFELSKIYVSKEFTGEVEEPPLTLPIVLEQIRDRSGKAWDISFVPRKEA